MTDNPDRTLRPGPDHAMDLPHGVDSTFRTMRPAQPIQPLQPVDDEPMGDCFVLKGDAYENVRCISDNSGEAQIFLVRRAQKEYVLKLYYPNFDVNKKLLQLIHSFRFEMIVHVFDYGKTYVEGKYRNYELMEYLRGGTLQDFSLGEDLTEFRRIALQAAAALAYCHNNNILHKDIKPANFFFRDEKQEELVLGDFGISSLLEDGGKSYRTTQARTPIFAAPEMYADVIDGVVEITPAADFYSLGITLFALWLGENPMSSNERVMMRQKNEGRLPRLNELPERVKRIVQGLTSVNPASRWGYKEVERWFLGEDVPVDIASPFLRYKSFIVDPDRNLVAENVHELIPMLIENERLATSYLYNGRIAAWLESCGNTKLATAVKDITQNRYPADQHAGLMASVYAMEPTYPYIDIHGHACDDVHGIALALLSNQDKYAVMLQNPNDSLFLWLELHTKCDVDRLRSYFLKTDDFLPHVSIMRMVYEISPDIPFLSRRPSSTIQEIVRSFGCSEPSDDDWHSLTDGRLLSWMYSHEDLMACESLRIMTKDEPYSLTLAYKVLYNMDRTAPYDLREADTPEKIGQMLSNRLKQAEHMAAQDLEREMDDMTNPDGRFYYYAQLHGWYELINEATRCFDLKSEENRERLSAYDLRTALYRYCRILGVAPTYLLPNGVELTDGRNIDDSLKTFIRSEMRSGSFVQWLSVFYHEDPSRDFSEEYSYERELEVWVMELGRFDASQPYYKRFVSAREETTQRIDEVRHLWQKTLIKTHFWRYTFYGFCAVWALLVLIVGVTGRDWLLSHWLVSICLPVGSMTGIIVATRSYFKGIGPFLSFLLGLVGASTSFLPVFVLKYVEGSMPSMFNVAILVMTAIYMVVCVLTDFSSESKADVSLIKEVLNSDDIKSTLIEPLYYTFKTRSFRYKSSKFGLLNQVSDQVRSISGESVIHYVLWSMLMGILIAQFVVFSPKLMNVQNPSLDGLSTGKVLEQIQKEVE